MTGEQIVTIDGATLRAASLVSQRHRPDAPIVGIEGRDMSGQPVCVYITAGPDWSGSAEGARELAQAATAMGAAAEAAREHAGRVRHMAEEIDGGRGGDAA